MGSGEDVLMETSGAGGASFLALDRVHAELDELFLQHQEALFAGELAGAGELLDRFVARLRVHMRHEEDWLLPLYEERRERVAAERAAAADVYRLEHARMLALLAELRAALRGLEASGAPAARDVIALLDRESTFKHLVEHHDTREHNALYPALDRLASAEERRELTARCEREWARSASPSRPAPRPAGASGAQGLERGS